MNNHILTHIYARTFSGHSANVNSVCFSPDGNTLVSGSNDGSIKIWRCDG
ncbi:MAG: hypothetical protein EAZ09_23030 [Oscillatoriales cyanobacterium]|nr:MAG: hypothetical protein EAZ18_12840 [Oscillatoriales cyanobacterium]TAH15919.1 MAG: hypothetical protein EAZ09_23030 [Oscillatoriales cyanobacterium]